MAILDGNVAGTVVTASVPGFSWSTIDGFTIRNGQGPSTGGIDCSNSSPSISNNSIIVNNGSGINCSSSSPPISNNIIAGNRAGSGISCSNSSPAISNNTIVGNASVGTGGAGINLVSGSPLICNNIVGFNGLGLNSTGTPTLSNNCVYNPGRKNYLGLSAGVGDISVDPQFLAADYGNFHLKSGSPCIDAGLDSVVQSGWTDVNNETRIQGTHVDIGADEFNGLEPPFVLNIIRVSPFGNDANDGSSWALAKLTVQAGIDAAAEGGGGDVWVAAGIYNQRIALKSWAHLYGGFARTESIRGERNWVTHVTILDGGAGGIVVTASSPGYGWSAIDGFSIRNGRAANGGGINCSGSPFISNNIIIASTATSLGGGIYCIGSPFISNNTITGNKAATGGGIYCNGSSAVISNNTIVDNHANSSGGGGGVYCSVSPITISNNLVAFNSSGLNNSAGSPILQNNCVYNPAGANYTGLVAGTGDISVDPQLVAADYGNFHLRVGSPCIDTGLDSVVPSSSADMDGQPRIQGAHVDIGADEFNGITPPFVPNVVRVSPSGNDANDGSTWALAKLTVQAGIDAAATAGQGDIWVATGTYNQRITLKLWTHIYGGFAGSETIRDQRNWAAHSTIIDGGAGGSVVTATAPGFASSSIDGFIIRNGSGTLSGDLSYGGGIICSNSSPTISNNTIAGNTAGLGGGGIACIGFSSPTISNNAITGNIVSNYQSNKGGGIYCDLASLPTISNNTIIGNAASRGDGGGIYSLSSPAISNNIVAFNSSGLFNSGGTPILRNNCVYNPAGANYTSLVAGTGDISVDPQLVAADYGNFHLRAGSPCIDTGLDSVVPSSSVDMDGQPRIQGAHVDMGLDEFNGTTPLFVPNVVRVSPAGNNANDGSTWALAKLTVQAGIDAIAAAGGGDVWVAAGTYNQRITLKTWVHVYGGFAGSESSRNQRNWVTHVTILDGQAAGSVVTAMFPGDGWSVIDGFTIRNGKVSTFNYGGGIYCAYSSPTISNNTITGNVAGAGGGIYCAFSSFMVISNNTITGNTTNGAGGILCDSSANLVISNNMITGNSAIGGSGGGIYSVLSSLTISNNTIAGNIAGSGGGIWCSSSSSMISNNIVAFNSYGLYDSNGTPLLRNNCVYNPAGLNYTNLVAGTGDISVDPLFINAPAGDYRLAAGSPCIDAGYNAGVPAGMLTDFAGHPRFLDNPATRDCQWSPGNCGSAPIVDMGAFEFVPVFPGDFNRDGYVNSSDLTIFAACATGPGISYDPNQLPQSSPGCTLTPDAGGHIAADFNVDGIVDMDDFGIQQRCYSGNQPANPNCAH